MERLHAINFSRDHGTLELTGIRAADIAALRTALADAGLEGAWSVADLSQGAWRGNQVATEILEQLALDPPRRERPAMPQGNRTESVGLSYADVVGEFIDAEARGDRATLETLALAETIRSAVCQGPSRLFLVMTPRYGLSWENENELFIRFLIQALRGTSSRVVLVATGSGLPATPAGWSIEWQGVPLQLPEGKTMVGILPGVLSAELGGALESSDPGCTGSLVRLANGHLLIPPELRRDPSGVSRNEFDHLASITGAFGWLEAWAQYHGNRIHVEPWVLYIEGMQRFAEGGSGITLRLLERAIEYAASPAERGIFQAQAQGMRLALQRFEEAAAAPLPALSMPPELRGFLLQAKGWGLVMTDEMARAEECFSEARALMAQLGTERREYLYLLNISALCRLKSGNPEGALAMEAEIEERAAHLERPDRRLEYVNFINIARLHRRLRDPANAEIYFNRAFRTTLGARSESDAIYTNVCMARLLIDLGRTAEGFAAWMRAGLHWAASGAPEAIGPRAATAIIGGKPRKGENTPEMIAAAIADAITAAAHAAGIAAVDNAIQESGASPGPAFVRAERFRRRFPHALPSCGILASGIAFFCSGETLPPQLIGERNDHLRSLLFALLRLLAPEAIPATTRMIVVDDAFGREIPATPAELLAACARLSPTACTINGVGLRLDRRRRDAIEGGLRPHIGPAVDRLGFLEDQAVILFRRYRKPLALSIEESRVLRMLAAAESVDEMAEHFADGTRADLLRLLRSLEAARVVTLDLEDDAAEAIIREQLSEQTATIPQPAHHS